MLIEQYIGDKGTILAHAMQHPALAPKRKPTIETALKCVVSSLEMVTSKAVSDHYLPLIRDIVDMHELESGEYDTLSPEDKDEWSSAMDDKIEALFEPLTQVLSADWLARFTIDTHMHEENACDVLAKALGKEVFKSLSYGKQPGAVLSNAGILRTDVDAYFEQHMANPQQEQATVDEIDEKIAGVVATIHAQVGADFDIMSVADELDNICDDDEILAGGSGQRLGLDEDDLLAVQMYVVNVGKQAAQEALMEQLQNYKPGKAKTPPKPPAPPAPAAGVLAPSAPAATVSAAGAVSDVGDEPFDGMMVLSNIKEHSSVKDTDMAASLGVSRSTYLNWVAGKTVFSPDDGQRTTLRNQLISDINALAEALANTDGVPFERPYE